MSEKSKPLVPTRNNLEELLAKKPESQIDRERRAELTLLVKCMELPNKESRQFFCKQLEVPWADYRRVKRKYKNLIKRYRKDQNAESKNSQTNNL